MRNIVLTAAVLALAGCGAPEIESGKSPPVEPTPAQVTPTPPDVLTAQGWGPLRIGMTRAEVEAALGPDARPQAIGGAEPEACDLFRPNRAPEGLMVMVENNVLTSIWLDRGATLKTDRGFGVGDQAAAIKAAYGSSATASPHKYSEPPAEYVTTWVSGGGVDYVQDAAARGISYHIGTDGNVEHIAVGGPSIQYVEGCS